MNEFRAVRSVAIPLTAAHQLYAHQLYAHQPTHSNVVVCATTTSEDKIKRSEQFYLASQYLDKFWHVAWTKSAWLAGHLARQSLGAQQLRNYYMYSLYKVPSLFVSSPTIYYLGYLYFSLPAFSAQYTKQTSTYFFEKRYPFHIASIKWRGVLFALLHVTPLCIHCARLVALSVCALSSVRVF